MGHNVLSLMIFIPLAGMAVILCLPSRAHGVIRWMGVAATVPPLLMSVWLLEHFDPKTTASRGSPTTTSTTSSASTASASPWWC